MIRCPQGSRRWTAIWQRRRARSTPANLGTPPVPTAAAREERDELAAGHTYFEDYTQRELRDDRVLFFVDHMAAGMYHYRYLARATTFGKFVVPSTRVEEMYTPETFGRNGATWAEVK